MRAAEDVIKEIDEAIKSGQKIKAIKLFRQATGLGLKESKEFIDSCKSGDDISVDVIKNLEEAPQGSGCGTAALFIFGISLAYKIWF